VGPINFLLNILWFVFGGFLSGLAWLLAGVIMCITLIGIPWAPAAFRIAGFSFWPFGRVQISQELTPLAPVGCLLNVVWFVFAGWWLALHHLVIGFVQMLTIIGIPFGFQHFKLALLSLAPVGKRVVAV
jgi:uncharacterized membrane protein YccF (DUF307 family)